MPLSLPTHQTAVDVADVVSGVVLALPQILKAFTPALTLVMCVAMGLEQPSWQLLLSLLLIAGGTTRWEGVGHMGHVCCTPCASHAYPCRHIHGSVQEIQTRSWDHVHAGIPVC